MFPFCGDVPIRVRWWRCFRSSRWLIQCSGAFVRNFRLYSMRYVEYHIIFFSTTRKKKRSSRWDPENTFISLSSVPDYIHFLFVFFRYICSLISCTFITHWLPHYLFTLLIYLSSLFVMKFMTLKEKSYYLPLRLHSVIVVFSTPIETCPLIVESERNAMVDLWTEMLGERKENQKFLKDRNCFPMQNLSFGVSLSLSSDEQRHRFFFIADMHPESQSNAVLSAKLQGRIVFEGLYGPWGLYDLWCYLTTTNSERNCGFRNLYVVKPFRHSTFIIS